MRLLVTSVKQLVPAAGLDHAYDLVPFETLVLRRPSYWVVASGKACQSSVTC